MDRAIAEARAALAAPDQARGRLRRVQVLARLLEGEPVPEGPGHASLLRACQADGPARIALLEQAAERFDGAGVRMEAAACRLRLAQCRQDAEAWQAASRSLRALGVREPERWAGLLAPGSWPPPPGGSPGTP